MNKLQVIWVMLNRPISFHIPSKVELLHKGDHWFHAGYLAAVGFGSHHVASIFALLLLGVIIILMFVKEAP